MKTIDIRLTDSEGSIILRDISPDRIEYVLTLNLDVDKFELVGCSAICFLEFLQEFGEQEGRRHSWASR